MVDILIVPPSVVDAVWPAALELLIEPIGMTRGCYEPEDVYALCLAGKMALVIAAEGEELLAAYVVEIVTYPRKKRLRATFAGAVPHALDRWLPQMVEALEQESRRMGCSGLEALGRKGWTKVVDGEVVGTFMCRDFPAMELN